MIVAPRTEKRKYRVARQWGTQTSLLLRSIIALSPAATLNGQSLKGKTPTFERVYALAPNEGVFAYARISPDGRLLAYASESNGSNEFGGAAQVETVVSLRDKRVIFRGPGIDAYWSPTGEKFIYQKRVNGKGSVSIVSPLTGSVVPNVAPNSLGDYYSWGTRGGRDVILTIMGRYFFLDQNQAVLPAKTVPACPGFGMGERPLISKDGLRITAFVGGMLVVRNLTDCDNIVQTGAEGAKADFSWDGRYIAFHSPKPRSFGYEIRVVDLKLRTMRTIGSFDGSSFFPSWTRDGRLCFRYESDDYNGFVIASNVLAAPTQNLEAANSRLAARTWESIFPETTRPATPVAAVLVWAAWSAHTPDALRGLSTLRESETHKSLGASVLMAVETGSHTSDVLRNKARFAPSVDLIPLAPSRVHLTEATNQVPVLLVFRDGKLATRILGAVDSVRLRRVIDSVSVSGGQK